MLLARGPGECDDLVAPSVGLRSLAHGAQVADGAAVALAIRRLELGCDEQAVVLERRVEIVHGCDPRELESHRHRHRQPCRGLQCGGGRAVCEQRRDELTGVAIALGGLRELRVGPVALGVALLARGTEQLSRQLGVGARVSSVRRSAMASPR